MSVIAALVLILAQAGSVATDNGARPAECDAVDGVRKNVWERAKSPALRQYCDLLASGATKVAGGAAMAKEALALAGQADKTLPGRAAPLVLDGRAAALLGRFPDAFNAFREAKTRDDHALDDPSALLAFARSAARTNHMDDARAAYQLLLPRASALSASDRGVAYDEAGMAAMSAGPKGLDEAIATFRQGERDSQDVAQTVAVLGLALALDRAGQKDEAKAVLAERIHGDTRPLVKNALAAGVLGAGTGDTEADALAAIGLEATDMTAARETWKKYADHAPAVWADHARAKANAATPKRGTR
ncbi:MAG: hypothetical protein ACRELY_30785 [Polyangiaceae bacterium]